MPSDRVRIRGALGPTDPSLLQIVSIASRTKGGIFETTKAPRTLFPVTGAARSTRPGINEVVDEWRRDIFKLEFRSCELLVLVDT